MKHYDLSCLKRKKRGTLLLLAGMLCLALTACGPSEEKITQAQQKYAELTQIHNTVVDAHKDISDNSLDETLSDLKEKVDTVRNYNLQEMNDEEIDLLIQTMDALIASYDNYLEVLGEMKAAEIAAVLTPIPVTLSNNTELSFVSLSLYEENSPGLQSDVLDGLTDFAPGQSLTGLMIYRDAALTPWVLKLTGEDGTVLEFSLPAADYSEAGITLILSFDAESEAFSLLPEKDY